MAPSRAPTKGIACPADITREWKAWSGLYLEVLDDVFDGSDGGSHGYAEAEDAEGLQPEPLARPPGDLLAGNVQLLYVISPSEYQWRECWQRILLVPA